MSRSRDIADSGQKINFLDNVVEDLNNALTSVEGTEIKSTGETGTQKYLRIDGDNSCSWDRALPAGIISPFAMSAIPTGWLACNGANNISKSTYADLYNALTANDTISNPWGSGADSNTFKVPDLRGAFLRGIGTAPSNSDYVGPTNVGDSQDDQNASHSHSGSTNTTGNHNHTFNYQGQYAGQAGYPYHTSGGSPARTYTVTTSGNHSHSVTINNDGGTEARVFNFGVQYCIKY